jgi:protein phosphatase 2C family protein 2/3
MTSSYLQKPILTKKTNVSDACNFTATTCEMQGWRKNMEDSLLYKQLSDEVHLFAVCDGHGGPEVSALVAKLLPDYLIKDPDFKAKQYSKAFVNVFKKIDEFICSQKGEEQLKALNKSLGGRKVEPNEKIGYRAGTTMVAMIMTEDKYYVANAGDSRAILSRNHEAVALSHDHKPENPS